MWNLGVLRVEEGEGTGTWIAWKELVLVSRYQWMGSYLCSFSRDGLIYYSN